MASVKFNGETGGAGERKLALMPSAQQRKGQVRPQSGATAHAILITDQSSFCLKRTNLPIPRRAMSKARFSLPRFCAVLFFGALPVGIRASAQTMADPIPGAWAGQLRHDREMERIALRFELDDKKALLVTFDQPDMNFYNRGPGPVEKHGDGYNAPL
jgi:hypothetical protein